MSDSHQVVVVGASAAGMRCASRLARLQPTWSVRVIEQSDVFAYAACGLPYAVSGDVPSADHLRKTASGALRDEAFFADVKGVEVLSGHTASQVDAKARRLKVANATGEETWLAWDELVLATGARPRRLPGQPVHDRVRSFHSFADVKPLYQGLARGEIERVVIVGAGYIGLELCEALREMWDAEVTLLEAAPSVLPGVLDKELAALVEATLTEAGVTVRTSAPAEKIEADDDGVRVTAAGETYTADLALVAVGVEPVTTLAASAGVKLGPTGAIAVDEHLATSVPHVWAAGDCVEVQHAVTGEPAFRPLGSLANRQGRTLANVLSGKETRFPPVVGAGAVKVFGQNVASCGLSRAAAAKKWGERARSVIITTPDRSDFWPEAKLIFLQLTWDTETGRALGLQGVGEGDVAKRVDTASQLIVRGATVEDLAQVEHAYAPPYAPAVDPLNVVAWAAANQVDGVETAPTDALTGGYRLLDVRHAHEQDARPAPGDDTTGAPLENLRKLVADLPDADWIAICERGSRSAEAVRIVRAAGGKARYVAGGLRWWSGARGSFER